MSRYLLFLSLFLGLFGFRLNAQEIVTDISQYEIELRHTFKGRELLLFGAIPDGANQQDLRYDVIIIITGEEGAHEVWRKQRTFGFWLNRDPIIFQNVPEYYALASTKPIEQITDTAYLGELKLGIVHQDFAIEGTRQGLGEYIDGIIQFKENEGLYQVSTENMPIQSGVLFRSSFFFPENVPSGSYTASAYLFLDKKLVGQSNRVIKIDKAGIERRIYLLAHNYPAFYGLLAIVIALLAGWLAGFMTRKRTKIG